MADWFGDSGFNLDFSVPDFNWDFGGYYPQDYNFDFSNLFQIPDFNWDFGGFNYDPASFQIPDPLALPSFDMNFQSQFNPSQGLDTSGLFTSPMQPPTQLADLGFGNTSTPQMALPSVGLQQGSDPITNLMGSDQGQGGYNPFQGEPFMGLNDMGLPGGSAYANPGMAAGGNPFSLTGSENAPLGIGNASLYGGTGQEASTGTGFNAGPLAQAQGALESSGGKSDLSTLLLLAKAMGGNQPTTMDTVAKLAASFGPTILGAAGLGMQAVNRPQRNPLEDQLIQARIQSTGQMDALAKDRLAFEKQNAQAQMEAQMAMQSALLESRKPGGQGNIDALLKGNPQLAALYQALTKQTTGLAGGGDPEFNALLQQIAQVDIAELERQAQQQKDQAQETAARTGVNPANIIAEIDQRLLQEKAKALANARSTLVSMIAPGVNVFNGIGGLFGNLFQTPAAG